jgi:single-strand DNA-binding protein
MGMIRGLNKVLLIGFLSREPEMRSAPNGKPVTSFSLCVTRDWSSNGWEKTNETEWFNIVTRGNLAGICKQLVKGQYVYIEGRLQTRKWVDGEGVKYSTVVVVCSDMIKLTDYRGSSDYYPPGDNSE